MRVWQPWYVDTPHHAWLTFHIATCLTFSALALFMAFFSLPSAPFLGAMAALVLRPTLLGSHTQAPADSRTRRLTSGCQRVCLSSQAVLRCQAAGKPSRGGGYAGLDWCGCSDDMALQSELLSSKRSVALQVTVTMSYEALPIQSCKIEALRWPNCACLQHANMLA